MSIDRDGPLELAARQGDLEALQRALDDGCDPRDTRSSALIIAADLGHEALVSALLPLSNPLADGSQALLSACRGGHLAIATLLLPVSAPKTFPTALFFATLRGHEGVVQLLLPACPPPPPTVLRLAVQKGFTRIVELLLPYANVKAFDSEALAVAIENGHAEMIPLLGPVSDGSAVLNRFVLTGNWHYIDDVYPYVNLEELEVAAALAPPRAMRETREHIAHERRRLDAEDQAQALSAQLPTLALPEKSRPRF